MTDQHQARVLIVEDLARLSMDPECMLADLDCTIIGSATRHTGASILERHAECPRLAKPNTTVGLWLALEKAMPAKL